MEYLLDYKKENLKYLILGLALIDILCLFVILNLSLQWNILLLLILLISTSLVIFRIKMSFATLFMFLIIYTAPLERWNWKIWFTLRPVIIVSLPCFYLILIKYSLVNFRISQRARRLLILFYVFTIIFLLSSLNAMDFIKSIRVTILNITLFILFFIVVHLTNDIKSLRKYVKHWMIIGLLLCVFGISQLIGWLHGLDLDALLFSRFRLMPYGHPQFNIAKMVGFRIYSIFGDSNNFAAFLNTVFPLLLASSIYFLSIRKFKRSLFFGIGSLIVGSTLILTLSRSGWIGLLFGSTVILLDKRRQIFKPTNIKYIMLFVIIFLILINPFLKYLSHSFQGRLAEDESLKIHRFVAQSAISMFLKNPVLGVGIGNWGEYYGRYYKPGHENWNAHSAYLQILSEVGIMGFILYMILFYFVLKQILYFKKNTIGYDSDVLGSGLLAGFIGLLGANIFYQNYTFQFFTVFLGLAFVSGNVVEWKENEK